jgi:glycyl-tRNA synthetase beta chain
MMQGRDLVFELGTEELPSSAVYSAIEQLQVAVPTALKAARLEYGSIAVVASPRRVAVLVNELAERQADTIVRSKGPAARAAFDADGQPTKAAVGFARSKGVEVESLEVVDDDGGSYVYAVAEAKGVAATEVLPDVLAQLACGIEWAKSMRWGSGDTRFARPVRWIVALFGSEIVPVRFAGLEAGRVTYGHRFLAPGELELLAAFEYPQMLESGRVAVDHDTRARLLREGIERAASEHGGSAVVPEKTFAEVVNLVEWPTVAVGVFDDEFLRVPREMLEYAMGGHQRYFPLERADGSLDNRFIVAHNGDSARTEQIIRGHERVIRARLADAAFFYDEDLSLTLEQWRGRLEAVVFQEKLGTVADKVDRVERLAGVIAEMLGAGADEAVHAARAAHLCKADLVTNAVVEFTDLQGVMGRYYAQAAGEAEEVALAIEEHYRPRFAGDGLPSTLAGRIVSIADKADTICGIFAAGLAPRGSADPFALRRQAIGILQMALDGTRVRLGELIADALAGYSDVETAAGVDEIGSAVRAFIVARLEGILRDRGFAYDTVDAVLAVAADDPADTLARCEALESARAQAPEAFEDLSIAFKRAANLAGAAADTIDRALMGPHELGLADALDEARSRVELLIAERAYGALLETYAGLRGPIDEFFDNVLVMDEDAALRDNRLGLLARFVDLFERFADFSLMAG